MSELKKVEERLRKKQQEIAALEEKVKAGRAYIQALQDVLKILSRDADDDEPESKLRPGSAVAQARDVILDNGSPMQIDEILSALGKAATRETRASLVGSIAAYVRRDEIFTRPAPNTFGLIELGHDTYSVEDEPAEPPAGFGRQPIASDPFEIDDDSPF